jgi:hypothetical protein
MERGLRPSERLVDVGGVPRFGMLWGVLFCFVAIGGIIGLGQLLAFAKGDVVDPELFVWPLLAAAGLAAAVIHARLEQEALREHGVRTQATVAAVVSHADGDGNEGWHVEYRYLTPSGLRTKTRFIDGSAQPCQVGDATWILVDPQIPGRCGWIEPDGSRPMSIAWTSAPGLATLSLLTVIGVALLAVDVRVYDDPGWWSTTSTIYFIAWLVICFPSCAVLNANDADVRRRPWAAATSWVILGLAAEVFVAFGLLTTSPLNH